MAIIEKSRLPSVWIPIPISSGMGFVTAMVLTPAASSLLAMRATHNLGSSFGLEPRR